MCPIFGEKYAQHGIAILHLMDELTITSSCQYELKMYFELFLEWPTEIKTHTSVLPFFINNHLHHNVHITTEDTDK